MNYYHWSVLSLLSTLGVEFWPMGHISEVDKIPTYKPYGYFKVIERFPLANLAPSVHQVLAPGPIFEINEILFL
jgi:hypothetical protein